MIVKTYSVFCDAQRACTGNWIAETTISSLAARKEARNAGWLRVAGKDVCPDCAELARQEYVARNGT